ncbi:MAG: hydrogenase [Polyangiaceae bacterium]
MSPFIDPLLILLVLSNLFVLGTSRLRAIINATAIQGLLLGVLTLLVHHEISLRPVLIAIGTVAIKAVVIPRLLDYAMREVAIRREVEPIVGYTFSLVAGASGTAMAVLFSGTLPLAPQHVGSLLIPTALSTVLTGFILLTTRRKAITQVAGYLVLENGVFVMGLALIEAMPFLVETGVLLDLVVGIFIMGIVVQQIGREFASLDTTHLSKLKE